MEESKKKQSRRAQVEKKAYRISEFCEAYGIGQTKFHDEVACGRLKVKKRGRMTLIPTEEAEAWLDSLEQVACHTPKLAAGSR